MIVLPHEQGSDEWIDARLGIPTASQFEKIVTAGGVRSGPQLSKQRHEYAGKLLAEWWLQEPYEEFHGNEWTERGKELEPEARRMYGFETGVEWETCGFIKRDDLDVGASPDALVPSERGGVEIKCPMLHTHIFWLALGSLPRKHYCQVQGGLWCGGGELDWWDFVSYHPDLPMFRVRVSPEKQYQDALDKHLPVFCAELERGKARLIDMGVEPR